MNNTVELLGWRVVIQSPEHGGEWTNIDCKLMAEVCAVTREGEISRIRKKYSLGWNGKRFANNVHLEDIKSKNPKLFAEICKMVRSN